MLSPRASATRSGPTNSRPMMNAWARPSGLRLRGVGEPQAEIRAVAEQPTEGVLIVRRRDDEDVADARQHQRRQRVVHHRLAVDGHQLLADGARQREQPRARAAGENDALCDGHSNPRRSRSYRPACTASHQSPMPGDTTGRCRPTPTRTSSPAPTRARGESSTRRSHSAGRGPGGRRRTSSARRRTPRASTRGPDSTPPGSRPRARRTAGRPPRDSSARRRRRCCTFRPAARAGAPAGGRRSDPRRAASRAPSRRRRRSAAAGRRGR